MGSSAQALESALTDARTPPCGSTGASNGEFSASTRKFSACEAPRCGEALRAVAAYCLLHHRPTRGPRARTTRAAKARGTIWTSQTWPSRPSDRALAVTKQRFTIRHCRAPGFTVRYCSSEHPRNPPLRPPSGQRQAPGRLSPAIAPSTTTPPTIADEARCWKAAHESRAAVLKWKRALAASEGGRPLGATADSRPLAGRRPRAHRRRAASGGGERRAPTCSGGKQRRYRRVPDAMCVRAHAGSRPAPRAEAHAAGHPKAGRGGGVVGGGEAAPHPHHTHPRLRAQHRRQRPPRPRRTVHQQPHPAHVHLPPARRRG